MRTGISVAVLFFLVSISSAAYAADAVIDSAAPVFSLDDHKGNTHSLSDYRGKVVVLEWINFDCPFVKKHYESGNMPRLQKQFTEKGVVWLSISSSAPGKQGHLDAKAVAARIKGHKAQPTAYLIDSKGTAGQSYGAKTTPHMFIVDKNGALVYAGGIDDKPSTDKNDVAAAHNYVAAALEEILAEKPVSRKATAPYGCSVKY